VNLIAANSIDGTEFRRSPAAKIREFDRALRNAGIETSTRAERGTDIEAACGQLRQHAERAPGT
jgi:23S rRNA (adenine2503-C2)-methyltransferase